MPSRHREAHVASSGRLRIWRGYGFVNFVDPESAARACDRMNGQEWRRGTRAQPIKIVPARVQGFGGTLDNFMSQGEAFEVG